MSETAAHPSPEEHSSTIRELILDQAGSNDLSPREARFVMAFFDEPNLERAAIAAGYAASTAKIMSGQWLDETSEHYKPLVHSAIRLKQRAIAEAHMLRTDDLVAELKNVAFTDPMMFFDVAQVEAGQDEDGNQIVRHHSKLKDIADIPAAARMAIEEIEQTALANGKVLKTKFKMRSKDGAIDKLMKHLGGYERDNLQKAQRFVVAMHPVPNGGVQQPSDGREASIIDHDPVEIARKRNVADMEQSNDWLVKNNLPDPKQV